MSNASITSASRPRLEDGGSRKRSFGRMFNKIKLALRRRDTDTNKQEIASISTEIESASTRPEPSAVVEVQPVEPFAKPSSLLLVDDEDNIPGLGEDAIIPLQSLGRDSSGLGEAKTKQFFARHGLTYHAHEQHDAEPAAKMRRVEKPVRMRVRWTCHSCRAVFGVDKYCLDCGHRRCFDCIREPGRRANIAELRESTEATSVALRPTPISSPPATTVGEIIEDVHAPVCQPKQSQEPQWRCTIQIGRPRADSYFITSTKSQPRRHCHECEQPTTTVSQSHCDHCQHELCTLCPTLSEVPVTKMVPMVDRVYKKPRQRVRYSCEHCKTQFTGRDPCNSCGHERCADCIRWPSRKPATTNVAAILELQAKLAPAAPEEPATTVEASPQLAQQSPMARL